MKGRMKFIIVGLFFIVIISYFGLFFNTDTLIPENPKGKKQYYTQILNNHVKLNDNDRYEYVLETYDVKGKAKELTFTTGKKLKDGAFVELYVAPFRGVTFWQEVDRSELPEKVVKLYK